MRAHVTREFPLDWGVFESKVSRMFSSFQARILVKVRDVPAILGGGAGGGSWGTKVVQLASPRASVVLCSGQVRICVLVRGACLLFHPSAIVPEACRGHQQEGTGSTQVTALAATF